MFTTFPSEIPCVGNGRKKLQEPPNVLQFVLKIFQFPTRMTVTRKRTIQMGSRACSYLQHHHIAEAILQQLDSPTATADTKGYEANVPHQKRQPQSLS